MSTLRGQITLPKEIRMTLALCQATGKVPRLLIKEYRVVQKMRRKLGQRRGWRPRIISP